MSLRVEPGPVSGTVRAPPSKSVTHRALVLALLAGGGTIDRPLLGEDTEATIAAVEQFGGSVSLGDGIEIVADGLQPATIDAANSGTTLRIATAVAALCDGPSRLTGDSSLRSRPMGPLVTALDDIGAAVMCLGEDGTPPVVVNGSADGGTVSVDATVSSQFLTALCLIGPRLPTGLTVNYGTDVVSWPYVELTLAMLEAVGVEVDRTPGSIHIPAQPIGRPAIVVPGDYSTAAFPLVAGAMAGGPVDVVGLPPDAGQGDERIEAILAAFGVPIERHDDRLTVSGPADTPASIDLGDTPDLFPPLATLAATIEGTTELTGAPHLRAKESDRIAAMVDGLNRLDIEAEALDDGARIGGGTPSGGTVEAYGDHRIQMALALLGLVADGPVEVIGRTSVHQVSYPTFVADLGSLGATVFVDDQRVSIPATGGGE